MPTTMPGMLQMLKEWNLVLFLVIFYRLHMMSGKALHLESDENDSNDDNHKNTSKHLTFSVGKPFPKCFIFIDMFQFSSVQSLSCVRLFVTPWIAALQASLSITSSRSSLRLTSIKSVMPLGWTNLETVSDFILGGSKITADGDCSHEIKRRLLLGRTVMSNLDSIFKSRDITLPTMVRLVKAVVFPVVMYGCESWTVKKADAEELMLLNCGVGEDSWESLGLQGDPTSPF